jgi:hypothetical protein
VKDFIQDPVLPEHDLEIRKNFQITERIGILPGDTYKRNYRKSLIVDLGGTLTWPFYTDFEFQLTLKYLAPRLTYVTKIAQA